MLPIPQCGTICFRNSPGALVRFNFHKKWSPATGMLRARQVKSLLHHFNACEGCDNPSGTRTRFSCLRNRFPTHRRTGHRKMAEASGDAPQPTHRRGPSGFQPAAARWSALASMEWQTRMDLHHQPSASEAGALLIELQGFKAFKMDPPAGAAPAWSSLRKKCVSKLRHGGIEGAMGLSIKWCFRKDLHLEPRSSQNRVQDSYTLGALK